MINIDATAQENYFIRMVQSGDKRTQAITVQRLEINTVIVGGLSSTVLDMTFCNPNDRRMEGTFELPLPEGWTLAGFALDIDGKLRQAVTVPKAKGREAFEAVVRRGADPALVEHVAGNMFRARVYPFEPKGVRRMVVTLDNELSRHGAMDAFVFPYCFDYGIREFSLKLRVAERPVEAAKIEGLPDIPFVTSRRESVLEYKHEEVTLSKPFCLKLTRDYKPSPILAQEGKEWIYALPVTAEKRPAPAAKPKRIVLLWDCSESRRKTDKAGMLALLRGYFAWMGKGEVELRPFAVTCAKGKTYKVENGKASGLMAALDGLPYDGATDLNAIPWASLKGDAIILVSDAVQTIPTQVVLPKPAAPVYCITAGGINEDHWLRGLAMCSGGALVRVSAATVTQALAGLTMQQDLIRAWGTADPDYLFPCPLTPEGSLWVYGVTAACPRTLVWTRSDGVKRTVSLKGDAALPWTDADVVGLLRRRFVEQEMLRLREAGRDGEAEALARQYAVVTPKTSLIVLEEVADYLTYGILPPEELRKEYDRLAAKSADQARTDRQQVLENLVKQSDEQTSWWEGKKKPETSKIRDGGGRPGPVRFARTADAHAYAEELAEATVPMGAASSSVTGDAQTSGRISIQAWDSDSPYLKVLQYAEKGKELEAYYRLKEEYGVVPAFYLDAAEFFFGRGDGALAYRIITNVLEKNIEVPELLRAVARVLEQRNMLSEAETIYRKVAELAPHEPQSLLDLGMLLGRKGQYQEAVDCLYRVATGDWQHRFSGVNLIAMNELNAIVNAHPGAKLDLSGIDKRLLKNEPVDVRIVLSWANDNTDVDLHVTDPDNEECYYGWRLTRSLGKISNDITQGYGPEEYMQRKGMKGEYRIKAKLFSNRSQSFMVPQYVYARCYLYYGTPRQQMRELSFRIEHVKDEVHIGSITFE